MISKIDCTENKLANVSVKFVNVDFVAARYGVSKRHIMRLEDKGEFPPPLRLGRAVRWDLAQLEEWERNGCKPISSK